MNKTCCGAQGFPVRQEDPCDRGLRFCVCQVGRVAFRGAAVLDVRVREDVRRRGGCGGGDRGWGGAEGEREQDDTGNEESDDDGDWDGE